MKVSDVLGGFFPGHAEIDHTLFLMLGCAVQCEDKEKYINQIKSLDTNAQQCIVELIKKVSTSKVSNWLLLRRFSNQRSLAPAVRMGSF